MKPSHPKTSLLPAAAALTTLLTLLFPTLATHAQLHLRLLAAGASEDRLASNIVLHVPQGASPSPFLAPGPFTAEWTGSLQLDLRADFQFQAQHIGAFSLTVNGTNVFESSPDAATTATATTTPWSPPVRLKKGANSFRAVLIRTNHAETSLRLSWRGRGVPPSPIPPAALFPPGGSSPGPAPAATHPAARRGRDLFLTHHCGKCHAPEVATPIPDLAADAPSFVGIGSRRNPAWIARWILDPQALQPAARMPRLLHGPSTDTEAADITAWLASQTGPVPPPKPGFQPVPAIGRSLVDTLLCRSCHTLQGEPDAPEKITLRFVPEKFPSPESLADYLRSPERNYAWSRMPNFQLSEEDAAHIASFLLPADTIRPVSIATPGPDPERLRRGRTLAQDRGCFQCHNPPEATPPPLPPPTAPPVIALSRAGAEKGCLAGTNEPPATVASRRSPKYRFTAEERADLAAFLASGNASLGRHVPVDFAERWTRELRCGECHGKAEGLPRLEGTGEKLRPEWFARCVAGQVPYKPRTWLAGRMPGFPAFAAGLAEGYASLEGLPARSPDQPPPDPDAAAIGRKLVSASAGFACVTCHAIGPFSASAVFEAPGVNLAHAADRLRPDYFVRWVRNPQAFDPTTKMPLYFDEDGNSALADYYGGDGPKTLRAIWEYLRPGPQILPPAP